jgi:hypothetical protein
MAGRRVVLIQDIIHVKMNKKLIRFDCQAEKSTELSGRATLIKLAKRFVARSERAGELS